MKKILLFTFINFLAFMNLCSAQEKDWTLLIYVVGSDIVADAITDIGEMKAAGNTDNINIVGLLGGSANEPGWDTPESVVFIDGEEFPGSFVPSDLTTMASASNLTEFLNWGIDNYPAGRYMLAFYNHGMAVRGFGHDNVSDSQFTINDLKAGIQQSNFIQGGNKFDVIGYDACLMACIEAMSAMKDLGHYYVASEEEEPWHAWNWTPIITALNTDADITEPELGEIIVDNFIQQATDNESKNVTLSMVDLSKITALETSLENLFAALDDDIYLSNLLTSRANSEDYGSVISDPSLSEDMVDIGDLMGHLKVLEPGISTQIDNVLSALGNAVVYEKSDAGKPKASGVSMYVPLNAFIDEGELDFRINSVYNPLTFNQNIKDFIVNDYVNYGKSDNESVLGDLDDDTFGFVPGGTSVLGEKYAAIKIPSSETDLHQIQVVLLEEITGTPSEFILLGSALPDTSTVLGDGSIVYGYEWDENWLGINGRPAYIADIQEFDVSDDDGNFLYTYTQLHIPAILNPGGNDETDIVMTYDLFADGTYLLEEVRGEHNETGIITPSRENIQINEGDEIQLIYEIFNADTGEAVFAPNGNSTFSIGSAGQDDLSLEYDQLEVGNYHLGFVLMDHAHNDTIIYDPLVRQVFAVSTEETLSSLETFTVYPNPIQDVLRLKFNEPISAFVKLVDANGREVHSSSFANSVSHEISVGNIANGAYVLMLIYDGKSVKENIIIKQ